MFDLDWVDIVWIFGMILFSVWAYARWLEFLRVRHPLRALRQEKEALQGMALMEPDEAERKRFGDWWTDKPK